MSDDFFAFVDGQLADAELNALEGDANRLAAQTYAFSAALLDRAEAGERVDPALWPFLRDWLDASIRELETLRG